MPTESWNGKLSGSPSAVSLDGDRLDVFAVGTDATVQHWSRKGGYDTAWVGPDPLPVGNGPNLPAEELCAVVRDLNLLDVFAGGGNGNTPWHWWWDGTLWNGPEQLPTGANMPAEGLSAVSWAPSRLDVFAAGRAAAEGGNTVWHWWRDNMDPWQGPASLPSPLNGGSMLPSAVSAASWGPGRLDVFAAVAGPNSLQHWWSDDSGGNWNIEDLGGNLPQETVRAVAWEVNTLDVFAGQATTNSLQHWTWDGAKWSGPQDLGPTDRSLPAEGVGLASSRPTRRDIFAVQAAVRGGGPLLRWWWDGSNWNGPIPLGGNLPAATVTAVAGTSGQLDVFAYDGDSLQHWPAGTAGCTMAPWENWAGNQRVDVLDGHCHPASLEELVAIVTQAGRDGGRVRAVGSSWSFSDVAKPVSTVVAPQYLIETDQLNHVLTGVLEGNTSALNGRISADKLVHIEAGIKLSDLMVILDHRRQAPYTMGGSDGQSLAGALSTCVHGADFDRGPLPEMVRAIHLIDPGGIQHWIEPTDSITDRNRLRAALGLDDANIHYDDAWFNAVLVSVGTMGIIYSAVIEVVPQYDLVESCQTTLPTGEPLTWGNLRPLLANGAAFAGTQPRDDGVIVGDCCVQVAIDPSPPHQCFLVTRYRDVPTRPLPAGFQAAGDGSGDVLGMMCQGLPDSLVALAATADPITAAAINALKNAPAGTLGDAIASLLNGNPGLTSQVVTYLTRDRLPERNGQPGKPLKRGFAHTIMAGPNPGECATRGLGLEIALDATDGTYLGFIDKVINLLDVKNTEGQVLGGWFSLRFVGCSPAYLSPQRFKRTCMVEFVGLRGLNSTEPILQSIEAEGRLVGGIQHWGMFGDLTAADVFTAYPNLDAWRAIRWQLTQNGTLRTFDNVFSERCGLSAQPIERTPVIIPTCMRALRAMGGLTVRNYPNAARQPYAFVQGSEGNLWLNAWSGTDWSWADLSTPPGIVITDPMGVVAAQDTPAAPERPYVFAHGSDDNVWVDWWDGTNWSWSNLGTPPRLTVAAPMGAITVQDNPGAAKRPYLFAKGSDGHLWLNVWSGSAWSWADLGTPPGVVIATPMGAVAVQDNPTGPERPYVFALGSDGNLWVNWWDGGAWSWANLGTAKEVGLIGPLGAITVQDPPGTAKRPHLFAQASNGSLWLNSWDTNNWNWANLGAPAAVAVTGPMGAIVVRDNPSAAERPYVFVQDSDGNLWVNSWDGMNWIWTNQRTPAGVGIVGSIGAMAVQDGPDAAGRPYVFVRGNDGNVWLNWWDGARWSWTNQGKPT